MSHRVDDLLAQQRRGWRQGQAKPVEQYLREDPALSADEEGTVDLIYQEFVLRAELGQAPSLEEYVRRFPHYRTQLQAQLAFLRVVREVAEQPPEAAADWPRLDRYEVLGELGRGAMGVVYKARQRGLGRLVALKMLHPGTADGSQGRTRFRSEAEKLARLRHPNIVQVYDVGEQNGRPYFAMELVEGSSLAQQLAGACLPDGLAARLAETLARATHHAHQRGIIHRDLKPGNILLQIADCRLQIARQSEDDASSQSAICNLQSAIPKITDFGLAKQLDAAGQTHSGMIVGTPAYMAPEQGDAQPHAARPAVDVYALGVVLYELLTGRPPFQAATPLQVLEQVRHQEPAPPSRWNAGVARDLETICLKCLHKEPGRRYGSAEALAEDLRRFQCGEPIQARPVGPVERGWLWCRRRPVPAGLLAALVLALLGSLYLWHEAAAGKRLAVAEHRQTDAARRQADEHVGMLLHLLTANLEISGSHFLQKAGGQPISLELLAKAEAACTHLREQRGDDPELQRLQALVWTSQGTWHRRRWQYDQAAALLARALDLWDHLPAEAATRRENRWGRVRTLWELGKAYGRDGLGAEAMRMHERAYQECRHLSTEDPSPDVRAAEAAIGLWVVSSLQYGGRFEEARRRFDRLRPALEPLVRETPPNPELLGLLAFCCERFARGPADPLSAEAARHYERAYQAQREAVQADQNDPELRILLSGIASSLIALHHKSGRPEAALQAWQRHTEFHDALLRLHPGMLKDDPEVLQDLSLVMRVHASAQQTAAARAAALEAAAVLDRCPDTLLRDWEPAGFIYRGVAFQLRQCGARGEALRVAEQYVQRLQRLAQNEPANLRYQADLGHAWAWLSKAHWELGQREETLAALRQAVTLQRQVLIQEPDSARHCEQLGEWQLRLARKLCELGRLDEAKQCIRERQRLWPGDPEKLRKVQRDLERWAAQVTAASRELAPAQQAARQRYLELSAWVLREVEAMGEVDGPERGAEVAPAEASAAAPQNPQEQGAGAKPPDPGAKGAELGGVGTVHPTSLLLSLATSA